MKKLFLFISQLVVVTLACDLSINITPTDNTAVPQPTNTTVPIVETSTDVPVSTTAVPATAVPSETSTSPLPPTDGMQVFFRPLSFVLPTGLASGISGEQIERADGSDVPSWGLTPGHTVINLEGYLLQGKFHDAQIYVYPATAYVEMYNGAFESIHRLDNILYGPNGVDVNQPLPAIPFFNAQQVFASNVQALSFQGGGGVRFLTEYAQYPASVNNHDLFYEFQGLSRDGAYYIIAIFPITVPVVADTSDGGAPLPPGGVAYPDISSSNPDFPKYYASITDLLNGTSPDVFSPTISTLDALIQSIQIIP